MSSTYETGLAKMTGDFNDLIAVAIGWGNKYVPSSSLLEVANLQHVYQLAFAVLKQVNTLESTESIAINQRQLIYDTVKQRATRVVNALIACEADKKMIADARTINRKIQGARAPKGSQPPVDETAEVSPTSPKTRSASQLSFDSLKNNVEKLVELVKQEPKYKPNEPELQAKELDGFLNTLDTLNTNVTDASNPVDNKRIERDSIFYDEPGGLVPLALKVKAYAISAFTASSPQFKQVNKLKFRNRKKK